MATKEDFLNTVRHHIVEQYDLPQIQIKGVEYSDKIGQFIEISKVVGGQAILLDDHKDVNELIRELYPDAKNVCSNVPSVTIATSSPDQYDDPHQMREIDLGIIEGEIGVAENGCVWVPQNVRQKIVYFVSEYLVILLDREKIVNNMHEAYRDLKFSEKGFGVFISGPSKTADIEQSLVVGAHGAKGVTVILK